VLLTKLVTDQRLEDALRKKRMRGDPPHAFWNPSIVVSLRIVAAIITWRVGFRPKKSLIDDTRAIIA